MTITLTISGVNYDITPYVDLNTISYTDAIDETLGSGGFVIPFIRSTTLGYDMSKTIPRYSKIKIDDDQVMYYYVAEDIVALVRKGTNKLYSHKVTLIEPTKLLQRRTIPNQTITQPQGNLTNYIYAVHTLPTTNFEEFNYRNDLYGLPIDNTATTLTWNYGLSTNDSIIDDNVLKTIRDYKIVLTLNVYNAQSYNDAAGVFSYDDAELDLKVDLRIDSFTQKTQTYTIQGANANTKFEQPSPINKLIIMELDYTPSNTNEPITIQLQTLGDYGSNLEDTAHIASASLLIQTYEATSTNKIMLDDVVDKLLRSVRVQPLGNEADEFTLSDETRARISTVTSPEFTWNGYTLYEALQECASYVGAMVYLGEDDFTTVHFYFYDDDIDEVGIVYAEEEHHALSTDFVTSLEINAENVIKEDSGRYLKIEPYRDGWMTVRLNADGGGQIIDTNSAITLRQGIYRPYQVLVKGLAFTMYDGLTPVNFANNQTWDITSFVVEQTKWSALLNTSTANSRSLVLNKGNTLYYIQGQNRIFNLGYNDLLLPSGWNVALALNYAVVEAILCQAIYENPDYTFSGDYKPTVDMMDLQFQVKYISYSNARAVVYRDDALGNQTESTMYFNEQASINDMKSLGDTAKKYVNRKGNEISYYKGFVSSVGGILNLGMKNAYNEKLTRYTVNVTPRYREIVLEYVKNGTNISSYRGVPSAYRQWQVPNDNLVRRRDKYIEFFYLSESSQTTDTIFNIPLIFSNYLPTALGEISTYAKVYVDFTGGGYTDSVEATVDTQVYGNTLVLSIDLADNYSAGQKRIEGINDTETVFYQQDSQYVDSNGKIINVKVEVYATNDDYDTDYQSNYPDNQPTPTVTMHSQIEYNVNKDAREVYGISEQLIFGSDSLKIKTYSGMAKYNGLAMNSDQVDCRPFLLEKGYFPENDTLDFTRLIYLPDGISGAIGWTSSVSTNTHTTVIKAPIGEYEGMIWVEYLSKEPIYAYKTSDFDTTVGNADVDIVVYGNIALSYTYPTGSNWVETSATTPDYTLTQTTSGYICPITPILPDPSTYTIGDIIKIDIYRLCNTVKETCVLDSESQAVKFCRSDYYILE